MKRHEVIIAVDPDVVGMSHVADLLEAGPFLPSRRALKRQIDIAREAGGAHSRVAVVVPSTHPAMVAYAHAWGADRVLVYHRAEIALAPAQQRQLRAAFAAVDLCIVPDEASELSAATLGADPDRLGRADARAAHRAFSEPPRRRGLKAGAEAVASLALDAAEQVGLISALETLSPDQGVNIVNYHRVLPLPELTTYCRPQMALAEPIFEAQLAHMAEHRGFAPLDQIHEADAQDRISITFDDGYEDNFRVALPVLQRYSTPACIFLVSHLVGQPDALWWDRVGMALFAYWRSGAEATLPKALPERTAELKQATSYEVARDLISQVLSDLNLVSETARNEAVKAAEGLIPPADAAGRTMLSWDEVQTLRAAGVSFGAHTRNHVPLDELPRDEATEELMGSQDDIEAQVGAIPYKTCALPRGRLGDLSEDDLRRRFTSVMTTDPGVHQPANPSLFIKRRDGRMLTLAGRHHPAKLRLELSGWVDRLRAAYQSRSKP